MIRFLANWPESAFRSPVARLVAGVIWSLCLGAFIVAGVWCLRLLIVGG